MYVLHTHTHEQTRTYRRTRVYIMYTRRSQLMRRSQ